MQWTSDSNRGIGSSFRRFLITLLLMSVAMMSGSAQAFRWNDLEITPLLRSETEYCDNIYWREENEEEDLIERIMAGVAVSYHRVPIDAELSYRAGFEFFTHNPDEDTWTHTVDGSFRYMPSENLTFEVSDTFMRSKEVSAIDVYGVERRRELYWSNTFSPHLYYAFGPNRSIDLLYRFSKTEFDETTERNSEEHTFSSTLRYPLAERHILSPSYTFLYGRFESDLDSLYGHTFELLYEYLYDPHTTPYVRGGVMSREYTGEAVDYMNYHLLLGIRKELLPHLTVSAEGGYLYYDPDEGDEKGGFEGRVTVSYAWERVTLEFTAEKGFSEVLFGAENLGYATSWGVRSRLEYHFAEPWWFTLSGTYSEYDYEHVDRKDRFFSTEVGLSYRPLRWLETGLRYAYDRLRSRGAEDYEVNRIMLYVQLTY